MPAAGQPGKSRLIEACRAVGWLLAVSVGLGFGGAIWAAQRTVAHEQRVSEVTANAFIARVRACRRLPPGPPPSWNACEQKVRAGL